MLPSQSQLAIIRTGDHNLVVMTINIMQKKKKRIIKFGLEKLQDYIATAESGAKTGDKFAVLILATTMLWC